MTDFICSLLKQSGDLLNILGMVGIALLTILIPITVAIFNDEKDFEILDRNVILDHVANARCFLIYIALVYIPILLWTGSSFLLRFIELIVWGVGIYLIAMVLINSYHWIRNDKFMLRFDYLQKLNNSKDMEGSWRSVWETKNVNTQNEKEFFTIFSSAIDKLLKNNDRKLKATSKLLEDFNVFVDNRSTIFLAILPEFFPKILEWHSAIWGKKYTLLSQKDKLTEWSNYNEISRSLDSILKKVMERALREGLSPSFFESLETHIEKYKDEIVIGEEHQYIYVEHIPIYRDILEEVSDSNYSYDIWNHYFPKSWKITSQNFKENIEARIWFKIFLDWAESRIRWKTGEEWDKKLDEVSKELFPSVSPSLWSRVLTFVLSSWSDSRIKNVIESKRNFGFINRIITGWGGDEVSVETRLQESHINEEKETIELTLLLFGSIFTVENIEGYIKELDGFDCQSDLKEQNEKLLWLDFLKKIQDHRKNLIV